MNTFKHDAILKDWSFVLSEGYVQLSGTVWEDKGRRFEDGTHILTSLIEKVDVKNGLAITKNHVYKLE